MSAVASSSLAAGSKNVVGAMPANALHRETFFANMIFFTYHLSYLKLQTSFYTAVKTNLHLFAFIFRSL